MKILLKFLVLSIVLVQNGTILPEVRETTHKKTYNFKIKSGMCKWCIDNSREKLNKF